MRGLVVHLFHVSILRLGTPSSPSLVEMLVQAQRDRHLQKLVESVWAAQTDEGRGFAAVKVCNGSCCCKLLAKADIADTRLISCRA